MSFFAFFSCFSVSFSSSPPLAKNNEVPSSVSLTLVTGGQSKVAEAKYGVVPGKEVGLDGAEGTPTGEPAKDDGPRKPLDGKRRGPLKRQ